MIFSSHAEIFSDQRSDQRSEIRDQRSERAQRSERDLAENTGETVKIKMDHAAADFFFIEILTRASERANRGMESYYNPPPINDARDY